MDHLRFFIVMEMCPKSLEDCLVEGQCFGGEELLKYLRQFQSGLAYLHKHKIIHRDLKPANVMFDFDKNLKIIDFGLAKENSTGKSTFGGMTMTQGVGTPFYMAPELIENQSGYGKAVDVYAWGIICWQFFTGESIVKFEGHEEFTSQWVFFNAVKSGARPPTSGFPPKLKELIDKCVLQRPEDRYTVEEIGDALKAQELLRL